MTNIQHRTIEDRLEEIEHGVHEIKSLLLKLTIPATFAAERLVDEFMNVRELADFAKVEPSIIYAACAKHELKFIRPGRLYKFKKQDILEWLDTCHNPNDNRSSVVNVDEYVEKYLQKNVLKG